MSPISGLTINVMQPIDTTQNNEFEAAYTLGKYYVFNFRRNQDKTN